MDENNDYGYVCSVCGTSLVEMIAHDRTYAKGTEIVLTPAYISSPSMHYFYRCPDCGLLYSFEAKDVAEMTQDEFVDAVEELYNQEERINQ